MCKFAFVLIFGSLTCVWSAQAQPPGGRDGEFLCANQQFKDAELAAYRALVEAQRAAEAAIADHITHIQRDYRDKLSTRNELYQPALARCNSNDCRARTRSTYTTTEARFLTQRDVDLRNAQNEEVILKEAAKRTYDAAVEKAKQRYCVAYKATGNDGPTIYSGMVCSLEKPFTVTSTNGPIVVGNEFTPSGSSLRGTARSSANWGEIVWAQNGPYTVEGIETDKPRIVWALTTCTAFRGMKSCGPGTSYIDLSPVSQEACGGLPPIAGGLTDRPVGSAAAIAR